ncbi:MAG: hypothetical protein FJ207_06500 [Gemmatimonadetes bacterium]|nr:hypothetical protein [Gemmatimonadota bacterium]
MLLPPTKTPIGTAWIDDEGILWHRLDFGVRIDGQLAEQTAEALADLVGERALPAVVDIAGVQFADRDARDVFARLRSAFPQTATALLVRPGDNPASGVLAYQFSQAKPDRPIAVFEREAEAVEWVRRFLPRS